MYKNGRLLDTLVMSLLREEWFAAHPELEDQLPDPMARPGVDESTVRPDGPGFTRPLPPEADADRLGPVREAPSRESP